MKILIRILLLFVCLLYGYIIALIFGKDNFNQIYLWTSFILFVLNNSTLDGSINFILRK